MDDMPAYLKYPFIFIEIVNIGIITLIIRKIKQIKDPNNNLSYNIISILILIILLLTMLIANIGSLLAIIYLF